MGVAASSVTCTICKRVLDQADEPLSLDCGGDCWGCVGEMEAAMGHEESLRIVREEFARGLRPGWVDPTTGRTAEGPHSEANTTSHRMGGVSR